MFSDRDLVSSRYASRLLKDRLAWTSLDAVAKSLLQIMQRLGSELGKESNRLKEVFLEAERKDVEDLLGRLDSKVVKRTEFLLSLNTNVASLEEARAAVEQGETLKRISWLTFIFLPLMFIASIFGMNVDWFVNDLTAKWYFVAATIQLVMVMAVYFGTKFWMKRRREGRIFGEKNTYPRNADKMLE